MTTQTLAAIHAHAGNVKHDAVRAIPGPAPFAIIGLVGMQPLRATARAASLARAVAADCVQRGLRQHAVVPVGSAQDKAKQRAGHSRDKVPLRAGATQPTMPTSRRVCRVRLRSKPLFFAGTEMLPNEARLRFSCPAVSRRSSNTQCRAFQTTACCHACRRCQHAIPEPHAISVGRCSQ